MLLESSMLSNLGSCEVCLSTKYWLECVEPLPPAMEVIGRAGLRGIFLFAIGPFRLVPVVAL